MHGLYPIIRRVRRPLVPVDVQPPSLYAAVAAKLPENGPALPPAPPPPAPEPAKAAAVVAEAARPKVAAPEATAQASERPPGWPALAGQPGVILVKPKQRGQPAASVEPEEPNY